MYLTAVLKIRANNHDRHLMAVAMGRWSAAMNEALDRARRAHRHHRGGPSPLLACLVMWKSKDGKRSRLVVDRKALHFFVLSCCGPVATDLHSSTRMSLIVAVEELLASYLGLYLDWLKNREALQLPRPSFPRLPPTTAKEAEARWAFTLAQSYQVTTLEEEDRWRADLLRAAKARLQPLYFGAATSGVDGSQAHMGLLRRADGRLFALLTLWGAGDPRGTAVRRARNRTGRGELMSVRSEGAAGAGGLVRDEAPADIQPSRPFAPTDRARASILCPLEFSRGDDPTSAHGRENLFLRRAAPQSAELVHKEGDWFLHVAFKFPEHPPRPLTGAVLAVKRGIGTLVAWSLLDGARTPADGDEADTPADGDGEVARSRRMTHGRLEGGELVRLVTAIRQARAERQRRGYTLKGERRLARITEAHLYSAGHQIIDLACRSGAEIVLLKDRFGRRPNPFLSYRHFQRLAEILTQLAAEAGLPPPRERELYGSWATCLVCGWRPGDKVRLPEAGALQCGACGTPREPEFHLASLLAWDTLRLRERDVEKAPPLGEFLRMHR